jgi:glutamate-1-semialdehyde aminotransferase
MLEPYIYDEPNNKFLEEVIHFAHQNEALVIFDEVITGFRTKDWSAQNYYKVRPDLTTMGKAIGNGSPISLVGGRRDVMRVLENDCFVSSTFGGDLVGINTALAVIKYIEENPVDEHIWKQGQRLKDGFNELTIGDLRNGGVSCEGHPCRLNFRFPTEAHRALFWQECLKRGILFGYATFICYSHREEYITITLEVIKEALEVVKAHWDEPAIALEGEIPQAALAAKARQ